MPRIAADFTESYIKGLKPMEKQYVKSSRGLKIIVYPSGSKSWSFYVTAPDGVRTEHSIGTYPSISYKEARAIATKLHGDMIKEGQGISSNKKLMSFSEYISSPQYINWSKTNRKAHKSIMDNLFNVIPEWFHNRPINSFTNKEFQRFVDERISSGVKPQTINRNLNNFRSVFKHAFNQNILKENPMSRFKQLKTVSEKEKLAFTDDERIRLLKVARDSNYEQAHKRKHMEFFVELGLYCGLRKSEITKLKWSDFVCPTIKTSEFPEDIFNDGVKRIVQLQERTVTQMTVDSIKNKTEFEYEEDGKLIWYIETGGDTKSNKSRKIPVPTHLVIRIRQYLWLREYKNIEMRYEDCLMPDDNMNVIRQNNPTAMNVFDDVSIIPYGDPKNSWRTIHKLAGLPKLATIHTLRHDFCTQKIKQGVDIYTVQRLAGHADIRTTMKYLHNLQETDFSALDNLEYNYLADPE